MADLTLPEVITRFRGNEARVADFANGNAAGYYITVDGKKVETLPSVVSRLAAAIAAASATAETLKGTGGAKLIGFGTVTVDAALTNQAKEIADNAKAITDLDTAKLAKGGGTMTGPLKLSGAPTDPLHAVPKGWAETLIGTYWKPGIGDVLATLRGAPDATWIPDGAVYLQASYPDLFAKVGLTGFDATGAANWPQISTVPATQAAFMAVGKDGVLVFSDGSSSAPVFRRSTDGGASFATINAPGTATITGGGTDGKGVFVVTCYSGYVYRSADNGLTWTAINTGAGQNLLGVGTDNKGTWIASSNGAFVMRSTDNGLTWAKVTTPNNSRGGTATNGAGVWLAIAGQQNIAFRSADNGLTWTQITMGYGSADYYCAASSNGVMVLAGTYVISSSYYQVMACTTDGLNWKYGVLNMYGSGNPYTVALDSYGIGVAGCFTSGAMRFVVTTDTTGVTNVAVSAAPTNQSWTVNVCTDGLGTWYAQGGSNYVINKCVPVYDVRTAFKVPKSLAQVAPYATFVKAK
ncbi:hypothetical protein QE444_001372 [Pseudomonas sp. SORGH_AS199]|uniref:WD40/YVTN/BNR-like repeat-containing protein n=1 Tax=Pseudomonas sp. SORGH_AS_0199 TaxID=3041761 RepID=UPI002855039D|nr:sialidase family protein [Pseudomonas sp. SORGH_AS_0199]MDR6229015.1 hypothetical protein [Pseudomonas sp. SORGH_AS_0199]